MSRKRWKRLVVAGAVAVGVVGLATIVAQVPAQARSVDPSSLPRGAEPRVPYLRHDTIRSGSPAVFTTRGDHWQLWRLDRGFLVLDGNGRLTWLGRGGERQLLGRSVYTVAVSPSRDRVVWGTSPGREVAGPVRLTAADVRTGALVARRTFPETVWAEAMTRHRVLLASSWASPAPSTTWWHLERRSLSLAVGEAAVGADVRAGRAAYAVGDPNAFCNRVAVLGRSGRTLWRSCGFVPRSWSPDGRHALVTHVYLDDAGTDYWTVVDARTGARTATVTGRLDWNPVWEDAHHFLVPAMGDDGLAAVVRCDLRDRCERATRLWDTGWSRRPPFYTGPPVLLARN